MQPIGLIGCHAGTMSFADTADVCEAARACCAAAGGNFEVDGTRVTSLAVQADMPAARNPGADDTEWICTITLEGTPDDLGKQLAVIHDALARHAAAGKGTDDATADNFGGFEP